MTSQTREELEEILAEIAHREQETKKRIENYKGILQDLRSQRKAILKALGIPMRAKEQKP